MSSCRGFRLFPARRPFGECRPALFKDLGGGIANVKKIVLALLDHFESYLCQFLLVFFVVVILLQIVLRQINMSLPWTEEIARFAFIWFILFGACYATRLCALNRVTLQFSRAPKWVGNLFLFIGDIIWLCFSLIMAWEGYIAVLDLVEFPYATPALDWDLGMVYLVFPLSFLLMAIRIVQVNVIKYILKEEILDPDQESIKESQETRNDGSPFPREHRPSAVRHLLRAAPYRQPDHGRPRRCDHGLLHRARH